MKLANSLFLALLLAACGSFSSASGEGVDGGGVDGSRVDASADADAGSVDGGGDRADSGVFRRVFVTSIPTSGKLGGVTGADDRCANLAAQAGLGGAWVAWVSTAASSAASRLFTGSPSRIWQLLDGTEIVRGHAGFASKTILAKIGLTEQRATVTDVHVWTATYPAGGYDDPDDCLAWSADTSGTSGAYGNSGDTGEAWTNSADQSCDALAHLYCFEQ